MAMCQALRVLQAQPGFVPWDEPAEKKRLNRMFQLAKDGKRPKGYWQLMSIDLTCFGFFRRDVLKALVHKPVTHWVRQQLQDSQASAKLKPCSAIDGVSGIAVKP